MSMSFGCQIVMSNLKLEEYNLAILKLEQKKTFALNTPGSS